MGLQRRRMSRSDAQPGGPALSSSRRWHSRRSAAGPAACQQRTGVIKGPRGARAAEPSAEARWRSGGHVNRQGERGQLGLFGDLERRPRLSDEARATARYASAIPDSTRLGTSSWSFEGWGGLVYQGAPRGGELVRDGLRAYAEHPLFRTVGVDRGFYSPLPLEVLRRYDAATASDFRFLIKAHDHCSLGRFGSQARYGDRRGMNNPRALDVAYARDLVLDPARAVLGPKLGQVLFQFPPQDTASLGGPARFPSRLGRFLEGLDAGSRVAVELRDPTLFTREYIHALRSAGATHALLVHPSMPPLERQLELWQPRPKEPLVVRWMLRRNLTYNDAIARFRPFAELRCEDYPVRQRLVALIRNAASESVTIIVNNKAEGSSPRSIVALARALAEDAPGPPLGDPQNGPPAKV
jgi:uncharacterized protein YecE (DUF72 family)